MKNTLRPLFAASVVAFVATFGFNTDASVQISPALTVEASSSVVETSQMLATGAASLPLPVMATASDLVTKVYGVFSPRTKKSDIMVDAPKKLNIAPESEETGVWLESSNGYAINYYGMMPDVSALAVFDGEQLTDYGYMFEFPYNAGSRDEVMRSQVAFCGSLLQELSDVGATLLNNDSAQSLSGELFHVTGHYADNDLIIRLIDDQRVNENEIESGSGSFVLLLTISPCTL